MTARRQVSSSCGVNSEDALHKHVWGERRRESVKMKKRKALEKSVERLVGWVVIVQMKKMRN